MEQTRRPGMDRDSGEIVLSQDKAVPQLSRNSPNSRHEVCGNALRRCGRSAERTGGTSFVVNMQRMRDKGSETRMRACGILSADGPSREKSGQGLDRRFRGRSVASRACSLHSSPAATLDSAARSAELSKYGRKAELSSAAGRRRFCSATRIYSCCGEPSHAPGERKASLCTSG